MKLYHATYRANLKSIFEHGLGGVQKKNWGISMVGYVYFSENMEMAISFCKAADCVPKEVFDSGIVCLEVDTECLMDDLLFTDPNFLVMPGEDKPWCFMYEGIVDSSQCTICFDEHKDFSLDSTLASAVERSEKTGTNVFGKDKFIKEREV